MDSHRYATSEPALEVLRQLYTNGKDRIFPVHISIPVASNDDVEDVELELFITRKYHGPPIFEAVNGDRTYRTTARFSPDGESFEIDVIIPRREKATVGATLLLSGEVNNIINNRR